MESSLSPSAITPSPSGPSSASAPLSPVPAAAPGRRSTLRILHSRLFAGGVAALVLVSESLWARHGVAALALFGAGLILTLLAVMGRLWATLYIGGRKDRELVTHGPYSLCRHPLYFFSALGAVGVAAGSGMLTVMALTAAGFGLYYPAVIRREEERQLLLHGRLWLDYCDQAPCFWPSWSGLREPEWTRVSGKSFRRACRDVVWFILALGLMAAVQGMHGSGTLPVLMRLP